MMKALRDNPRRTDRRGGRLLTALTSLSSGLMLGVVLAAGSAHADDPSEWGINGTYTVSSNGQWAKRNDVYHNEAVVRSTWTISTKCTTPVDCAGTVTSDQGWSAPVYTTSGLSWYVKRKLPRWEPCPDGTAADGLQTFRFYPVDTATGNVSEHDTTTLAGEDSTIGPSGACGVSKWLTIKMPFKAVKIS
jgi:hypothetical protein